MSNPFDSSGDRNACPTYYIRVKGHLGQQWSDWFVGLDIILEENGEYPFKD